MKRALAISLAAAALALVLLLAMLLYVRFERGESAGLVEMLAAAAVVFALIALWHAFSLFAEHSRGLERLRGAVFGLGSDDSAVVPLLREGEGGPDIVRLHAALSDLAARNAARRSSPDLRLQAVVASIAEAIVVITDSGQVSLVNHRARTLLGPQRVKVGTSVFAALRRETLFNAIERAEQLKAPVDAELETADGECLDARVSHLTEHGGAVISVSAQTLEHELEHRAEIECDLDLHDRLPETPPLAPECPLNALPVLALDTETTGLDVNGDRIVAIGAVRLHGMRMYRNIVFDRLVNPGCAIPPRSTAVHGISDAMVADAADFATVFEDLRPLLEGAVLVGHNVAFDLAMLRRECELSGIRWQEPPTLDTLLLVSVLSPGTDSLHLEALAEYYGVNVHGRHTAFGDSLVTAEVYTRLLPQLMENGVNTLGEAEAFCTRARAVIKRQKEAGW